MSGAGAGAGGGGGRPHVSGPERRALRRCAAAALAEYEAVLCAAEWKAVATRDVAAESRSADDGAALFASPLVVSRAVGRALPPPDLPPPLPRLRVPRSMRGGGAASSSSDAKKKKTKKQGDGDDDAAAAAAGSDDDSDLDGSGEKPEVPWKGRPTPYRAEMVLRCGIDELWATLYDCEERTRWDSNAKDMHVLVQLPADGEVEDDDQDQDNDDVDAVTMPDGRVLEDARVAYYCGHAALGGAISSRDFVDTAVVVQERDIPADDARAAVAYESLVALEEHRVVRRRLVSVGSSGHYGHTPAPAGSSHKMLLDIMRAVEDDAARACAKKATRGVNFPTGWLLEDVSAPGEPDGSLTRVCFMFQTDIKGWLPTSLVEKGSVGHMLTWWEDAACAVAEKKKAATAAAAGDS